MKMAFLSVLATLALALPAAASDMATETETYTSHIKYNFDTVTYVNDAYTAPRAPKCGTRVASSIDLARPCQARIATPKITPVRVKTYTEVIDHYTVYQPVVTYHPAGTYAQRRIVPTCNRCGN